MNKLLKFLAVLLLATAPVLAQTGQRSYTVTNTTPDIGIGNIGSGIAYHQLTWNVIGSVSACAVTLQQSANNVSWSTLISSQSCTTNGQSTVSNVVANYIRIDPTSFTGTAGSSVVVHWNGFNIDPSVGGDISGTISSGQVAFGDSTPDTITGNSNLTYAGTGPLSVGPTISDLPSTWTGVQTAVDSVLAQSTGPSNNFALAGIMSVPMGGNAVGGLFLANTTGGSGDTLATGIQFEADSAPASPAVINDSYGMFGGAVNFGTGTITEVDGLHIINSNEGSGIITTASDLFAAGITNNGGGTITNSVGVFFQPQSVGTNNYGAYFPDFGTGSSTYGIYQVGANTKNVLAKMSVGLCTTGCVLTASLTTTAATSDNVTITGMTSSGHCALTPTNATAIGLVTLPYISAKTTNQITVTHAVTANATFDIICAAY